MGGTYKMHEVNKHRTWNKEKSIDGDKTLKMSLKEMCGRDSIHSKYIPHIL
jgi:hypothetical protein